MKYILVLFLTLSCALICSAQDSFTIVGGWRGTDKAGNDISLLFDEKGLAYMMMNGEVAEGLEGNMTYTIKYDTTPITLDMVIKEPVSGKTWVLYGLVDVKNKDEVLIVLDDEKHPTGFTPNETATFYRQDAGFKIRITN